jgi:tripeptidyl-peptidase-2
MPSLRSFVPPSKPFPTNGLLPKETTQALQFIKKCPEYDGRNVRVAILDTGVDVAAIGLDGKGKMVDAIDCTGSGDIALIAVEPVKSTSADEAVKLKSLLTGRTLLLPSKLTNPSGKWWIGSKPAYQLWPGDLVKRRQSERRKEFDVEQSRLVDAVQNQLYGLEKAKASEEANGSHTKVQQREELEAQIAVLKELSQSYADPGPIIEVVVFHDGKHYRTLVGGAEGDVHDAAKGLPKEQLEELEKSEVDLSRVRPIADFRFELEHGQFGDADMLTYTTNVLTDDTDAEMAMSSPKGRPVALSLVVNSGSHATHVAGIVGAHRTDDEVKNGVAPGCEMVTMKIGDTRLGSMETQQSLLRAAQALIATKCDIANMSFGESGGFGLEDKGAFAEMLRDYVVRRRDILFISSAGNNGPAMTTVGMPGGTTSSILSIGAYVDAGAMQQAEYALVERDVPSSATTWCSRGPTADGAKGVDIYAPGAAITSIPRYCLQATMMANGTSMSSPNACGAIALLLSGMKKEKIPITAARVYKAVRATGKDVGDDLGTPFIQVDKAWDYIVEHKDLPDQDAEFDVAITPAGKPLGRAGTDKRGIYIRDVPQTHRVSQYNATVKPKFRDFGDNEKAYNLQLPVSLVATENWIQTPDFVFLGGNGRSFEVRVDASHLTPGLHSAFVQGYDSDRPGRLLFQIPVTVTKPIDSAGPTVQLHDIHLAKGKVDRRFIAVPEGATWMDLKIISSNHEVPSTSVRLWAHAVQLELQKRLPDVESASVIALNEGEPVNKRIAVKGGMTMELCLAQFFTNASSFDLDVTLEFHGITASRVQGGRDELTIIGGDGIAKLECQSHLRVEVFKPSIKFDKRRIFVRPSSSKLHALNTARDLLPNGKYQNELRLTYAFDLNEENNDISLSTPLSQHLYDSAIPMLMQLYDVNKKRVKFGDVYVKQIDKLQRGSYTLEISLLHSSAQVLESLRSMTLSVDQKLSKPVDSVDMYEDHLDQFGGAKAKATGLKEGQIKLLPGERKILCLNTNLEGEQLPKEAQPGDLLLGTMSFCAPNDKAPLRYLVPPAVKKAKNGEEEEGANEPRVVELLTGIVSKVPEAEKKAFIDKLLNEYPDDLGVMVARLESLKVDDKEATKDVVAASDAILRHKDVDVDAILVHIGSKQLPASEQTKEQKAAIKKLNSAKSALTLALNRKARALLLSGDKKAFDEVFAQYRKLADASDKEFANVYVAWTMEHGQYGRALQAARKAIKEIGAGTAKTNKDKIKAKELERELYQKLGWKLWSAVADRRRVLDSAKDYEHF